MRSASILVNGPSAEQAAKYSQKCLALSIGLHINLTEGTPLCTFEAAPTLFREKPQKDPIKHVLGNGRGQMWGKEEFWKRCEGGQISAKEVRREVTAQLERYKELFGRYPSHADGHQHVQAIPQIAKVICDVLSEYGVVSLRNAAEMSKWESSDATSSNKMSSLISPLPQYSAFLDRVRTNSLALRRHHEPNKLKEERSSNCSSSSVESCKSLVFPDHFVGLNTMGSRNSIENLITILSAEGVGDGEAVEWMVHPGYTCAIGEGDEFAQSTEREWEMNVLKSPLLTARLAELGYKCISFEDFHQTRVKECDE